MDTIKAVGYVRVSTADQAREGYSLADQKERIQAYCDAQRWQLVRIYSDAGISGAREDRPQFQKMLQRTVGNGISKIVFLKLDRLGRSVLTLAKLRQDLEGRVGLVSISEQLDTSSSQGKLFWHILSAFAEFERDLIRDRVRAGKQKKAATGGYVGGRPPYGYRARDRQLVEDAEEQEVIALMRDMRNAGQSYAVIAHALNREAFRPRHGSAWTGARVNDILNPERVKAWRARKQRAYSRG